MVLAASYVKASRSIQVTMDRYIWSQYQYSGEYHVDLDKADKLEDQQSEREAVQKIICDKSDDSDSSGEEFQPPKQGTLDQFTPMVLRDRRSLKPPEFVKPQMTSEEFENCLKVLGARLNSEIYTVPVDDLRYLDLKQNLRQEVIVRPSIDSLTPSSSRDSDHDDHVCRISEPFKGGRSESNPDSALQLHIPRPEDEELVIFDIPLLIPEPLPPETERTSNLVEVNRTLLWYTKLPIVLLGPIELDGSDLCEFQKEIWASYMSSPHGFNEYYTHDRCEGTLLEFRKKDLPILYLIISHQLKEDKPSYHFVLEALRKLKNHWFSITHEKPTFATAITNTQWSGSRGRALGIWKEAFGKHGFTLVVYPQ